MADKLKEIPGKVLAWWKKYTSRQRTIIIAGAAVVVFTFAILIYTFTKEDYTKLGTYENSAAAEIVKILDNAGVTHRESSDARTIEVLTSQLSQANLAIATEGFQPDGVPKYSDFVQTGMTITSTDRNNMYIRYVERYIENLFSTVQSVKGIQVKLTPGQSYGRLSDAYQESYLHIQLTVTDDFTAASAKAMAKAAAVCIGNQTTANITITDQNLNPLYVGGDDYSDMGIASTVQELEKQARAQVTNQVKGVLLGTRQFDNVTVGCNLSVDYTSYTRKVTEYYANSGYVQGMITDQDKYSSESTNGVDGVPGTDTNGGDTTGYLWTGAGNGSSSSSEEHTTYQPNISDTNYVSPAGGIDKSKSSISVSMITYREYYEANARAQGLLDGVTWAQFKANNQESVKKDVDEAYYQMVSNASGIDVSRITIIAYEEPVFYDREGLNVSITDVVSIVLIVLILALLAFVILRSMGPRKKAQEEEELSVESMLQSTPEPTVSDIDVETKSETRKMVEKFVDENPEAAASLLRNWLNEDWG